MSNDKHNDEQVSAAYRDLATERTPKHLDDIVLNMAKANAERPMYSRWMGWSRPLAWAATVALCLAITLEVTQVTTPDTELATPAAAIPADLQKNKPELAAEMEVDSYVDQDAELADSMAGAISSEKTSAARSAAKLTVNEPAPIAHMQVSSNLVEAERFAEEESVAEVVAVPTKDYEVKESRERRAEDSAATVGYAAPAAFSSDMPENECSEESRSEPESWLECISDLEASGDEAAATRQREDLIEEYPDFKLP